MTTFVAGSPLACSCLLSMGTSLVSLTCTLLTLAHLLWGRCIILRYCIIRCQHCFQVVTSQPVNKHWSDAKVSSILRLFRVASQALTIIQESINWLVFPLSSFSNLIIAWWLFIPDPNWFNSISKILSAVSRSSSFFATPLFRAVPSKLLSIAVQACLLSFKLSCSRCSLITSTHVSMQPSESSLNSLGFLKVFQDLPLPLSLESVFLVANASRVMFIISQVLAHVMASGCLTVFDPESSVVLAVFETPNFIAVHIPPDAIVLSVCTNGVDSRFFRCGSTKSTLVSDGFSTTNLSWANEFLKRASSLDCMAQDLSAYSLPIVSILVSRFLNFSFTVSYRFFISSISFLICFSRSLSVASTLPSSRPVQAKLFFLG